METLFSPKSQCDEQWQRIKKVRADQRLSHVFKDKESYARWKAKVENAPGSEWNDYFESDNRGSPPFTGQGRLAQSSRR